MSKKIQTELFKELLNIVRDTRKSAKRELPKVAEDLVVEGKIDAQTSLAVCTIGVLNLAVALRVFLTSEIGARDPQGLYLIFSALVGVGAIIGMACSIQSLLVIKQAPRAFLLNKLTSALKDE